jgi:hypothetical protein
MSDIRIIEFCAWILFACLLVVALYVGISVGAFMLSVR